VTEDTEADMTFCLLLYLLLWVTYGHDYLECSVQWVKLII